MTSLATLHRQRCSTPLIRPPAFRILSAAQHMRGRCPSFFEAEGHLGLVNREGV